MQDYQQLLFPYAYNILGSAEDARDAVQDVLYTFLASPKEHIAQEKSYLIKSVINQSINIRNRKKKMTSTEEVSLPEPVATETADTNLNMKDIVSYSMLVLLEQLNPKERAVFILKEAFNYSHEEIAEVLSSTVENSRKLLSRAKARLAQSRRPATQTVLPAGVLDKYIYAIRGRDTQALEHLLTADITYHADGGAHLNVFRKFSAGIHEVAELMLYIYDRYTAALSCKTATINHQPALLYYDGNQLVACQVFGVTEDGKIYQINNVLDPEKLKGLAMDQ
ncbi:sigma-70 family RNA polymerase sigma factor [Chitinophaga vietnamensis]|uniref:sigma-70 family RNA polymerase sigma factor n=1 Tax=Chitinophaga vietnamensis TaxID=2593957 RepID=UPI0011787C27|nr:sigma-70 family RNA polymerase sigma factor [Chitinophaga vietnamensis]